ncbi:glycosyl transferase group 1 [Nitrospira sp.]|nr:glycosyl transferase group 1 [Nitrospira sp.]
MRLLIFESSTAMGGQELAVLLHAQGLRKRGHELTLVVEPDSPIEDVARREGVTLERLCMQKYCYPAAFWRIRTMIQRVRPDIVHVNSSRDSWLATLAARSITPSPPVIRTRHISTPLNQNVTTRWLYRSLLDFVIVTGGELTRRALVERDGLDPDRVAAFPIGIDVSHFKPGIPDRNLRDELDLPPSELLVGLVSYLRSYKGHEYYIDAAARVVGRRKGVTFLISGRGPEEVRLRARITEQGVDERVRMLGYREDLLNVMHSLDLFVIPSVEGDTIPQVLMQAMAVGLPVVSTTVGSIPDVVRNGETGFVVPPRDAVALAERIDYLLDQETIRREMGRAGRALVERSYSLDRMLDELERIYGKVAG